MQNYHISPYTKYPKMKDILRHRALSRDQLVSSQSRIARKGNGGGNFFFFFFFFWRELNKRKWRTERERARNSKSALAVGALGDVWGQDFDLCVYIIVYCFVPYSYICR